MGRTQGWQLGRTVSAFALSLMLGLTGLACAKSSNTEASDATPFTNAPSTSTTASTTVPRKPCTEANLAGAASADYPEPKILDTACSSAAAVATIESAKVPGGTGVAFFANSDDGSWKLLKVWNMDDAAAAAPGGTPQELVAAWRSNYEARTSPSKAPTAPATPKQCPPEGCAMVR